MFISFLHIYDTQKLLGNKEKTRNITKSLQIYQTIYQKTVDIRIHALYNI